jgi:AraC-like DNA-binding protein
VNPTFEKLIPPEGTSIRCFNRREINQPATWHYHPEYELTYVPSGTGTRFVGDHIESYAAHDLVLLGSNLPHHWSSDEYRGEIWDRHEAVVVQFPPDMLGEQLRQSPELAMVDDLLIRSQQGLHFAPEIAVRVGHIMTQMIGESPFDRLIMLLKCLRDLSSARCRVLASETYSPQFQRRAQSRLHTVCRFIDEHLTDPALSQSLIAERAGMTPSAFCRFFRNATQKTVTQYVNELRVGMASRMLIESDRSILDICLAVGFENSSNFNRRFRQFRGMSPRDYRTRYRDVVRRSAV